MKILVLESGGSIGGGQVVTKAIVRALEKKYETYLMIPSVNGDAYNRFFFGFKTFTYKYYPYSRGNKTFADILKYVVNFIILLLQLFRVLISNRFDLIYAQHSAVLPSLHFLLTFFKIPCISHVHVVHSNEKTRLLVEKVLSSNCINRIVGVSNYSLSQFSERVKNKSIIIYNSVPISKSRYPVFRGKQIAVIGDVTKSKCQHLVVEALSYLESGFTLHILGQIIDFDYKQLLEDNSKNCHIVFAGRCSDVAKYLLDNQVVVVVASSVFETFSLAMTESWGVGIPTIASNSSGMKELVESLVPEYKDDILFEANNYKDLAIKISKLINNYDRRVVIADKLYDVANENFSSDFFETNILKLVSEVRNSNLKKTPRGLSEIF